MLNNFNEIGVISTTPASLSSFRLLSLLSEGGAMLSMIPLIMQDYSSSKSPMQKFKTSVHPNLMCHSANPTHPLTMACTKHLTSSTSRCNKKINIEVGIRVDLPRGHLLILSPKDLLKLMKYLEPPTQHQTPTPLLSHRALGHSTTVLSDHRAWQHPVIPWTKWSLHKWSFFDWPGRSTKIHKGPSRRAHVASQEVVRPRSMWPNTQKQMGLVAQIKETWPFGLEAGCGVLWPLWPNKMLQWISTLCHSKWAACGR